MKFMVTVLALLFVMVLFQGFALGVTAVPVSPGGGTTITVQNCPSFSWSAAEGTTAYRVEVYERITTEAASREWMVKIADPVIRKEIAVPALTWTPSEGECLTRGVPYVWYVGGIDGQGLEQWSEGAAFEVKTKVLTVEQQSAVRDVVKEYLFGDSAIGVTTTDNSLQIMAADLDLPMQTEGASNNFFGTDAGHSIGTGTDNNFFGARAGYFTDTGSRNNFFGTDAGYQNRGGVDNSFFGNSAGNSNYNASQNSFFGSYAGQGNFTGYRNSFFGNNAGYNNYHGYFNTFIGDSAGYKNDFSGSEITDGNFNTYIGANAGYSNVTGHGNVFLGNSSGYSELGSNKLYIDNCNSQDANPCDQPLIYGEFDSRVVKINGSLTMVSMASPSDIRYKKEIYPLESPLEKVLRLQGVTYEWDRDKVRGAGFTGGKQIGLIAQEVEQVLPELVHTDKKGYKTLSYDKLGPVLVEAVKEQQEMISRLEKANREKDSRIEKLENALDAIEKRLAAAESPTKIMALN